MAHDHDHTHSHAVDKDQANSNAFKIGIALNIAFVLTEVITGLAYNSMALLTDAGHNLSDVASLALSLIAFWMAKKKSNAQYTYGYKKTTVLAALLNAVILLVAIGVLGYESVLRLLRPQPVEGNIIAWVAGAGIAVNGFTAYLFFSSRKKELNAKSAYLHMLADALVSAGVVVGGLVMLQTKWYWLDPAIGLIIMAVILVSTWQLLRDSLKMTIDAVPAGIELEKIKGIMLTVKGVKHVSHVHVWSISTTENALTAHIVAEEQLTFEEKLTIIKNLKHELVHKDIHHSTIELEENGGAEGHTDEGGRWNTDDTDKTDKGVGRRAQG